MTEITKRGLMVGAVSLMAAGAAVGKTLAPLPPRRPPVLDDRIYEVAKPKTWTMSVRHVNPWGWQSDYTMSVDEIAKSLFKIVKQHATYEPNDSKTRFATRAAVEDRLRFHREVRDIYDFNVVFDATNNPAEVIDRDDKNVMVFLRDRVGYGFTVVHMTYADEDGVRVAA